MGCLLSLCFEARPIPTVSIAAVSHLSLLFHGVILDRQIYIDDPAVTHLGACTQDRTISVKRLQLGGL